MFVKRPTKREIESAAKRELIYEKALELFETYGYENTTIADICKATGMSTGSLYHFYSTKESLLLQICDRIGNVHIELEHGEEQYLHPYKPILKYLLDYSSKFEELGVDLTRQIYRVFEKAFLNESQSSVKPINAYTQLADFIEEAQKRGTFDNSLTAMEAAGYFITVSRGLMYEWCLRNGAFGLREKAAAFLPRILKTFMNE